MLNHVTLQGRLVRDPELRTTSGGVSVTNFVIAVDRDFGQDKKEADFPQCIAWRNTAEFIAKHFAKGQMIVVSGSLRTGSYTDKEGKKIFKTEVAVDNAYFGESKGDGGNRNGTKAEQRYPQNSAPKFEEVSEDDDGDLPF